ncbi:MAG: hypothetical protein PVS2B2_26710 [Candidatus Acidiferrum sp.]
MKPSLATKSRWDEQAAYDAYLAEEERQREALRKFLERERHSGVVTGRTILGLLGAGLLLLAFIAGLMLWHGGGN